MRNYAQPRSEFVNVSSPFMIIAEYKVIHRRHQCSREYTKRDSYGQTLPCRVIPFGIRPCGEEQQKEKFSPKKCGYENAEHDCQAFCSNDVVVVELSTSIGLLDMCLKIFVFGQRVSSRTFRGQAN